jgi:anti-anti-sigma factor
MAGRAAVVDLSGEMNADAGELLRAAYEDAAGRSPSRVLLEFSSVTYINSTGIALLVGILADARKGALEVVASGLSEHYREIFAITRVSDFMEIYPDEAAALSPSGASTP